TELITPAEENAGSLTDCTAWIFNCFGGTGHYGIF
ncbi:MAG: hypothetical protein ACI85S_002796, partial [Pseudohongiellaceae bacterium]